MGTWGLTAFEDDTALEFYDTFCEEGLSLTDVEGAMDLVLSRNYNLELNGLLMEGYYEPLKALVLAEILAQARGKGIPGFPDSDYHAEMDLPALDLSTLKSALSDAIVDKTVSVLKKIQTDKEMHYQTLWAESDSFESWLDYTNDLIVRLKS